VTCVRWSQLGYREKAWSVNKFAAVARRQGLPDTCVTILTKMYNYTRIEVQEAFAKVREQAKAYLALEGEATAGLNLVNTTNLEYLPSNATHSTAEIFRLKGLLLAKLGDAEQANQAFSSALQLCQGSKGGCWISWGTHCEERYALEKAAGQSGGAAGLMWLENMMTCYMMALRDASPASRTLVPRVLSLLSFETAAAPAADGSPGSAPIVHLVWGRLIEQVPTNVWLMYIPQLLLSLQRPEAALVQRLLSQVAAAYPQAIYCWLRTFLLERRDPRMVGGAAAAAKKEEDAAAAAKEKEGEKVAKKEEEEKPGAVTTTTTTAVAGSANASAGPTSTMAFDAAKEVMESLRHGHANLAAEMEVLLTEVGSKFMPNPEERLLAVVHALLHRFYKYPTATSGPVPQPLQRELAGVCRACFSTESSSGLARHSEFVKEYKEEFARELGPDSPDFPPTLAKATARLKEWRTRLQNNVEDRGPSVLCLEDESKMLRDFRPLEVST
jgi:transformation/transcription domain-associated protein